MKFAVKLLDVKNRLVRATKKFFGAKEALPCAPH